MSGPRDAATAQLCADLTSLMQSSPSSIPAAAATPPSAVLSSPALPALSAADVSDLLNTSVFQVPSASSTPSRSVFPSSGGGSGDNSQSGVVPQQQVAGGDSQSSHTFTDTQHASATPDVDVFASPVGGIHFDTGSIAGASSMSVSLEDNLLNSSLDTPHVLVSQEECTSEDESTTSSHPNVVGGGESDGGTKDVNPSTPAILAFEASLDAIMPSTRPTTPATPHVPSVIITTNADVHMPPVNVATSSDEDSDQEVVAEVDELDKEAGEQGDEDALHVTVSSSGSDVGGDGSGDGSDDSADPTYQPPKGDGKRRRFPKVPRLEGEASDGSGAPTGDDGNTDPGVTESNVVLTDPPEQAAADPSQSATVDKEKSTTTAVRTKVSRTGVLSRTSAWVWEYFSVPDGCTVATAEQVKCKLCTRMVKRGHLHKGFTLGTTALVSHMRLNHRAEFQLHDAPSPRKTAQGKAPPSGQSSSQTQSDDVVDLTRPGSSHDRQRIPPPPKVKRARKTKADRARAGHVDGARQSEVVQHFQAAATPVPGISTTIPNVQTLYLHTYVVCALCHGVISSGETVGSARFSALLCHMRSNHPDSVTAEGEAVRPTVPSAVRPLTPAADAGQHQADVEASQEDDSDNAA